MKIKETGEELFYNGSFEEGENKMPYGWEKWYQLDAQQQLANVEWSSEVAYEGRAR